MMMMLAPDEAERAISTICFCATLRVETLADGIDGRLDRGKRLDDAAVEVRLARNPKRWRSIPSVRFS